MPADNSPIREQDLVLILSGPFEAFPAEVEEIDAPSQTALVLPRVFDGHGPVRIALSQLSKDDERLRNWK